MDSRIEEFAQAIYERADLAIKNSISFGDGCMDERHDSYFRLRHLAKSMLDVVSDYRKTHPDQYINDSLQIRDLAEQVVQLRGQLRNYQEREQTMGWAAQ